MRMITKFFLLISIFLLILIIPTIGQPSSSSPLNLINSSINNLANSSITDLANSTLNGTSVINTLSSNGSSIDNIRWGSPPPNSEITSHGTRPAEWIIKKGLELFVYYLGDSMIEAGGNSITDDKKDVPSLYFNMLTYTVDPFQFPWVYEWWKIMVIFYACIAISMILGGLAWVVFSNSIASKSKMVQDITWSIGISTDYNFMKWFRNNILSILFPTTVFFGIYFILQVSTFVSGLLANAVLTSVPPTTDNMIVYIVMAFGYLVISILMAIRAIVIVLFVAGGLGLAAMYLIPPLEEIATRIFLYVLTLIFIQPLLIFIGAIGVLFIKSLPMLPGAFGSQVMYLGLVIIMIVISIYLVLSPFNITSMMIAKKLIV